LRLSSEERALLCVLESTLHVSEYTDHVDVASARRGIKARRILDGILEACHISTGLSVASGHEQALMATCGTPAIVSTSSKKKSSFRRPKVGKKSKKKKKQKQQQLLEEEKKQQHDLLHSSPAGRDPKDNALLFQTMFEIGRRNKVLNPSQMRTTYGKLMYLLQDSQNPTVAKSLGFSLHKDLVLVAPYLEQYDMEDLLLDPRLIGATTHLSGKNEHTGQRLPRETLAQQVKVKRELQERLIDEYFSKSQAAAASAEKKVSSLPPMSKDDIRRCIESISDAIAVVESNVAPVQRMLRHLEENFDPHQIKDGFSLQLSGRERGVMGSSSSYYGNSYGRYGLSAFRDMNSSSSGAATLSHSHPTQYTFVWQSLRLWSKVQRNMHKLWVCADEDLLSTSTSYHLYNTGQGLNRVQSCPRVGKVMRSLLNSTQQEAGSAWVGLSVVHLGDRDVPNALVFIDKYTQIPRFLNPIVDFIDGLEELCQDERVDSYVKKEFGSQEFLKLTVLTDYFKHGFDGSGDDGGSCIDGRLTSSWNWTSRVAKKKYYNAFMLSGFQGFDGDFK